VARPVLPGSLSQFYKNVGQPKQSRNHEFAMNVLATIRRMADKKRSSRTAVGQRGRQRQNKMSLGDRVSTTTAL